MASPDLSSNETVLISSFRTYLTLSGRDMVSFGPCRLISVILDQGEMAVEQYNCTVCTCAELQVMYSIRTVQ